MSPTQARGLPLVSIIIPTRNEEKYIGKCLQSVIDQDYPKDLIEILVLDGMSEDKTKEIVKGYIEQYSFIKILDNTKKVIPPALNIGIKKAKGEVIIRMDAHSIYKKDYISKSVKYLLDYNTDNVGGVCFTEPGANTIIANAIALALSSRFGVGNAYFRVGAKEPKYVDTVPFGCYKKGIFEKIGLFDEELLWSEDDEFNTRIIKNGGKILLVPEIVSHYHARENLSRTAEQYFRYAHSKIRAAQKLGKIYTWRQFIPLVFVASLICTGLLSILSNYFLWLFLLIIVLYLSANLVFSFSIAVKKGLKFLTVLPIAFATLHFSYGFGYLKGIWDFVVLKRRKKKTVADVPITSRTLERVNVGNGINMTETVRIKEAYARRKETVPEKLYSYFNQTHLFITHGRERAILNLLDRYGMNPLENKVILDLGCGGGGILRDFIKYGARPRNLYGIDLLPDRISEAKRLSPNIDFRCGNAEDLPYENENFDIVMQFTVFTSILDKRMKQRIASEMLRVLKSDGIILWYDYHVNNPKNPDVRGVKKKEIYALFPDCRIELRRITLAPPLTRLLASHSWMLCYMLEKIPLLCTHYAGVIRKG